MKQHANQPRTPQAGARDLFEQVRRFQCDVIRLQSTITALKLAAMQEENPSRTMQLYWPGLMESLEVLVPDSDALDDVADALAQMRVHRREQ